MLNRAVLIVRPKQPYLDWAASLDDAGVLPDPSGEQTAYLIPDCETEEETWDFIEAASGEVFERELFGWSADPERWPENRDFATFQEWFSIEVHTVVEDLVDDELIDDHEELLGDDEAEPDAQG